MSIQELLGLPSDVTQPNAYQLFGLELGESDQATIHAAIARRVSALKEAKSKAPPETWKRAAMAVQAAQRILKDPAAKAELDASFGIIAEPAPSTPPAAKPSADPLASLLPSAANSPAMPSPVATPNPVATPSPTSVPARPVAPSAHQPIVVPESMKMGRHSLGSAAAVQSAVTSPGTTSATASETPAAATPDISSPVVASPVVAPVIRQRQPIRRRKSPAGLIFGTLVLLLLSALVGGMGYFFWFGSGKVQVVKTDTGYQINTGGQPEPTSKVATPRAENAAGSRPSSDGVMKTPGSTATNADKSLAKDMNKPDPSGTPKRAEMTPKTGMPANTGMSSTPDQSPAATPSPKMRPAPAVSKQPTDVEIKAGQLAIKTAIDAVRTAKWDTMKSLAEMAESKAITREQKQQAETVYHFADLATYYRVGIRKALGELPTNSEISITKTRKVLVNEADENHLKINLGKGADGKPNYKNYLSDELPLVLANEIASYQIDLGSPEGKASKAVYQSIAYLATPEHRVESVEILRGLDKVEGADPKRLADFIETLGQ